MGASRHTMTIVFEVEDSAEYDELIDGIAQLGGEIKDEEQEDL